MSTLIDSISIKTHAINARIDDILTANLPLMKKVVKIDSKRMNMG